MSTRVWLSYDLSVKGDYENLYIWLDEKRALECGDSFSTFFWEEPKHTSTIKQEIKESLISNVNFNKHDRIYLVYKKPDGSYNGGFIIGSRKANPWEGSSQNVTGEDEQ